MEAHNEKLAYRSPTLTVYGDVRQLTHSAQRNGTTDRLSQITGMGMNCQEQFKTGGDLGGDEEC